MLDSFIKDWYRWSPAERASACIAGAAALLLLAGGIGRHLL
jgi:hypothetical protein